MFKRKPVSDDDRNWTLEFVRKTLGQMKADSKYSDDDPAVQEMREYEKELEEMAFEQA